MGRKPREERAGGVYHVYARGNDRERIFVTDADRQLYLALLGKVTTQRRWRTLAYCLMANHVHVLIETVAPNLAVGMQRLQGVYARTFNRRHGRTGHLFERRYGAVPVSSDAQLQEVARYIALNPVTAGLCARPERWPWSSHAAVTVRAVAPAWLDVGRLLEYFASAGGDPVERYERLVADRREAGKQRPGPLERNGNAGQPTPSGDCERIHSRSVSSPTRA
jgi:REP element-mobilizing transposase RayT